MAPPLKRPRPGPRYPGPLPVKPADYLAPTSAGSQALRTAAPRQFNDAAIYHFGPVEEILGLFREGSVDLVFTSPPYESATRETKPSNLTPEEDKVYNFGFVLRSGDEYVDWLCSVSKQLYRCLSSNGSFVLNIKDTVTRRKRSISIFKTVVRLVEDVGFTYIENYVWVKNRAIPNNSPIRGYDRYEYVLWFGKSTEITFNVDDIRVPYTEGSLRALKRGVTGFHHKGPNLWGRRGPHPKGAYPSNVLEFTPSNEALGHPAVMPLALAEWAVMAGSNPGDLVLDPFAGTGTTGVAAVKLGRRFVGIEINPIYWDAVKSRFEAFSPRAKRLSEFLEDSPSTGAQPQTLGASR